MTSPVETVIVETSVLGCNGGDGPLGHPRVYLTIGENGHVDCPYCGRRYAQNAETAKKTQSHH